MYLVLLIARLLIAAIFLIAGVSKLAAGRSTSRKALADFGVPSWLVGPTSIGLPCVELLIAFLLLLPAGLARIGMLSALALLFAFSAVIAANLALGRRPACNCFGQLQSKPIGWMTFTRNSILATIAGGAFWFSDKYPPSSPESLFQGFSSKDVAFLSIAAVLIAAVCLQAFLSLHLFRQNGRLLLRIEALEARPVVGNQPAAFVPLPFVGLPLGSRAIQFDLPTARNSRATLDSLLAFGKPVLLISTDPNCGPCNSLMPDVVTWQRGLADEITIALLSHGRFSDNRKKAAEFRLENVLIERNHKIAERYHAVGTPTGVLIRNDGTIGSPAMGGADAIRLFVSNKAWTEAGFAAFMTARALPPQPPPSKPALPIGSPVPAFTLPDLDGTAVESASFNGNGTVLLFWNPSCGFCQKMIPQLKEWEQNKPASGPRLVLVSGGSRDTNRAMGFESTVLLDHKFAVGQSIGASGTPSGVLIDPKGKIASALAVGAPRVMALLSGNEVAEAIEKVAAARAGSGK